MYQLQTSFVRILVKENLFFSGFVYLTSISNFNFLMELSGSNLISMHEHLTSAKKTLSATRYIFFNKQIAGWCCLFFSSKYFLLFCTQYVQKKILTLLFTHCKCYQGFSFHELCHPVELLGSVHSYTEPSFSSVAKLSKIVTGKPSKTLAYEICWTILVVFGIRGHWNEPLNLCARKI